MNRYNFFSLFLIISCVMTFFVGQVYAQSEENTSNSVVILAEVSLYDAMVWDQNGREFEFEFFVRNDGNYEPQLLYAVQLYKKVRVDGTDVGEVLVYEEVYPDVISIGKGEDVQKIVHFRAPNYFEGEYEMNVLLANKSGLMYSKASLGTFTFEGGLAYGEQYINPSKCFLTVQGEDTQYTLLQGVDIDAGKESVQVTCNEAVFVDELELFPRLTYRERSVFGDVVQQDVLARPAPVGSTDPLSVPVTMPLKPQSYLIKLDFVTNEGVAKTNPVTFRVVVQGESATVKNASFDKKSYEEGDTAEVKVVVSGSADMFLHARGENLTNGTEQTNTREDLLVDIQIVSEGAVCSEKISKSMPAHKTSIFDLSVPVTSTCPNPQAVVTVANKQGEVLSSLQHVGEVEGVTGSADTSDTPENNYLKIIIGSMSLLFLAVIGVILLRKTGKSETQVLSLLVVVSGMLCFLPNPAYATPFYHSFISDGVNLEIDGIYDINPINIPCNASLEASTELLMSGCGNTDIEAKIYIYDTKDAGEGADLYGYFHDEFTYSVGGFTDITSGNITKWIGPATTSGTVMFKYKLFSDGVPLPAFTTSRSYTTGVCANFTASIDSITGCAASDGTNGGKVEVSIVAPTTAPVSYHFKCNPTSGWYNNGSDSSYECVYDTPGSKTIGFKYVDGTGYAVEKTATAFVQGCVPSFTPVAVANLCATPGGTDGRATVQITNPNVTVAQYGFECDASLNLGIQIYGGYSKYCYYDLPGTYLVNYWIKDINDKQAARSLNVTISPCAAEFGIAPISTQGCAIALDPLHNATTSIQITSTTKPVAPNGYSYKCDTQAWATTSSSVHECVFDGPGPKTIRVSILDIDGNYRVNTYYPTVTSCVANFTPTLSLPSGCTDGTSVANVTATIVGSSIPVSEYRFTCDDQPMVTLPPSTDNITCSFDTPGVKHIAMTVVGMTGVPTSATNTVAVYPCDCFSATSTEEILLDGLSGNVSVDLNTPFTLSWVFDNPNPSYECKVTQPERSDTPGTTVVGWSGTLTNKSIVSGGTSAAHGLSNLYTLSCSSLLCPTVEKSVNAVVQHPTLNVSITQNPPGDIDVTDPSGVRFSLSISGGVPIPLRGYYIEWFEGISVDPLYGDYLLPDGTFNDALILKDVWFSTVGSRNVRVRVTDAWGISKEVSLPVYVGDNRLPQ
jgi:hypothetical protein